MTPHHPSIAFSRVSLACVMMVAARRHSFDSSTITSWHAIPTFHSIPDLGTELNEVLRIDVSRCPTIAPHLGPARPLFTCAEICTIHVTCDLFLLDRDFNLIYTQFRRLYYSQILRVAVLDSNYMDYRSWPKSPNFEGINFISPIPRQNFR